MSSFTETTFKTLQCKVCTYQILFIMRIVFSSMQIKTDSKRLILCANLHASLNKPFPSFLAFYYTNNKITLFNFFFLIFNFFFLTYFRVSYTYFEQQPWFSDNIFWKNKNNYSKIFFLLDPRPCPSLKTIWKIVVLR